MPIRKQFSLGSLMIAITFMTVGFAYQRDVGRSLLAAIAGFSSIVVPTTLVHRLLRPPSTARRCP